MKKLLLSTIVCSILTGCIAVPASRITFMGASAYLPKDFSADKVEATVHMGTNSFTFTATKMTTKNNPAVIDASTAQLTAVINATADAVGKVAGSAAKTTTLYNYDPPTVPQHLPITPSWIAPGMFATNTLSFTK